MHIKMKVKILKLPKKRSFSNQGILLQSRYPSPIKVSFSNQGILLQSRYPSPIKVSFSNQGILLQSRYPSPIKVSFSNQGILLHSRYPSPIKVSLRCLCFVPCHPRVPVCLASFLYILCYLTCIIVVFLLLFNHEIYLMNLSKSI